MSRLAGPSCRSILYCKPEQPPPTTATRNTPFARPCLVSRVETLLAALAVSLTRRSSPVRKFGADVGLLARLAIIFNSQQVSRSHAHRQRVLTDFLRIEFFLVIIHDAMEDDFAAFEMPVHVARKPKTFRRPLTVEGISEFPDRTDDAAEHVHLLRQVHVTARD